MSVCYSPMIAYRDSEGNVIFKNGPTVISELKLPCGQCIGCRLNHAEGWAIRMVHEAQFHEENSFITLTYSEDNLPENGSLNYEDVTKFIKKLRKALENTPYDKKLKYFRVGEYGDQLSRPHYHIILFGFDFSYPIEYKNKPSVRILESDQGDKKYYSSSFLTDLWSKGFCNIGEVNYNTCMYVAKYVTKKVNGSKKHDHYEKLSPYGEYIQLEQEKSSMSRRNGIGKEWLKQFWSDVYPSDACIHENRKLKTPKYYDKYLEKYNLDLYEQVKMQRESSLLLDRTQAELTMSHELKILTQQQYKRELDGTTTPTTKHDLKVMKYHKDEIIRQHNLNKAKKC